jgi:predicted Rossmann fold flavoprotein
MDFDVIVIGAGAAGMMCAAQAGQRGRRVLLIDHAAKIGERIRISGGGRCNFTNRSVRPEHFLSQNPHFTRSALTQFSAADFIDLVERYGITYHEKTLGQLFCDESAGQIITLLKDQCTKGHVQWAHPCAVHSVEKTPAGFALETAEGRFRSQSLVIATGGLAIPQLGATPFGYHIAEQFGLNIIPPQPALVPLAARTDTVEPFSQWAGSSLKVRAQCGQNTPIFQENLLFTHRGLSGPAILQVSSYWQQQSYQGGKKHPISLNLMPDTDINAWLKSHRASKFTLAQLLAQPEEGAWPKRLAQAWCERQGWHKPMAEHSNKEIIAMCDALGAWTFMPAGTLGYAKAEVTLGGVDTQALSSKTMACKTVDGLYFIGEVVDVTGWLGGYNFQWAWSSGWVAGQSA